MVIVRLQTSFGRIFRQRCFYLFVALIALISAAAFVGGTLQGRFLITGVQVLVLVAAVAAVGRTAMPFVIALLLGIPAFGFLAASQWQPEDITFYLEVATAFFVAFYLAAVTYLLR